MTRLTLPPSVMWMPFIVPKLQLQPQGCLLVLVLVFHSRPRRSLLALLQPMPSQAGVGDQQPLPQVELQVQLTRTIPYQKIQ